MNRFKGKTFHILKGDGWNNSTIINLDVSKVYCLDYHMRDYFWLFQREYPYELTIHYSFLSTIRKRYKTKNECADEIKEI